MNHLEAVEVPAKSAAVDFLTLPSSSKMLVVTRDKDGLHDLIALLEGTWEIQVEVIDDVELAKVVARQNRFDLLIVDHPSAADFLIKVRQELPANQYLPALVLVPEDDASGERKDLLAGADDFLRKPVDPFEALLRTHTLLSLRETRLRLYNLETSIQTMIERRTEALNHQLRRIRSRDESRIDRHRLHALSTMTSGVAHDFNNILLVVRGFAEQMLRSDTQLSPEERRSIFQSIVTAAEDGAQIVHRLREFYRERDTVEIRRSIDLNALVRQTAEFTRPKWQNGKIDLRQELASLPPFDGDPAQLREMLTNLIFNAVDAMPNGGTITIRTNIEHGRVVMEVADSGVGMPERVRRRCLEPFFTTKGEKGTGMGLAMVHGIAQRHGAAMELESEEGRGTVFRFRFGERNGPATKVSTPISTPAVQLRILVVDDQPVICDLLAEMLSADGHQVRKAYGANEALVANEQEEFDLLITDRDMPQMDGIGLACAIKAVHPATRVLMVSGSHPDEISGVGIDRAICKPVTCESLRRGVAETVGIKTAAPVRQAA